MTHDPAEPADLSALIAGLLNYREDGRRMRPQVYGAISNEGATRLLKLAYLAGMMQEEGRYTEFRLFVSALRDIPSFPAHSLVIPFAPPVPINDVEDIRKLAPAAASHDFALEVEASVDDSDKTHLYCIGVRRAFSDWWATDLFSVTPWGNKVPEGLMIRVDGPGFLRVRENDYVHFLRPGELCVRGLPIHPAQRWEDELLKKLALNEEDERGIANVISFGWHELLHLASDRRRGAVASQFFCKSAISLNWLGGGLAFKT